ncbi:MAG: acetolactate decarboxylase [Deferribacterales bacterium]
MKKLLITALFAVVIAGCAHDTGTITQISTIDALLAGDYDGSEKTSNLTRYGDFGIGTFDRLDGEMIVLDGKVYQAKSDGRIYMPDNTTTPFASVSFFVPEMTISLNIPVTFEELEKLIDEKIPDMNVFCAVKVEGTFSKMKVRSVPAQSKPYSPLAKVVTTQPVFEYENIRGTIVGYRLPAFVKGINVGGYHMHFIDVSKTYGGHILDFQMADGKIYTDTERKLTLILPERGLESIDLSKDRSEELKKVEK